MLRFSAPDTIWALMISPDGFVYAFLMISVSLGRTVRFLEALLIAPHEEPGCRGETHDDTSPPAEVGMAVKRKEITVTMDRRTTAMRRKGLLADIVCAPH